MAEEQTRQSEHPDETRPGEERQADLTAQRDKNLGEGKPPYQGVRIDTLGEVVWILEVEHWSGALFLPEGFTRANLSGAYLRGANLSGSHLLRVDLSSAVLEGANLSGAHLVLANLSGAYLNQASLSGTDLGGANLSSAVLIGADLSGAHLARANLSSAGLFRASLSGAHLLVADLSGAFLREVNLSGAVLFGASLSGADLHNSNLSGADLSEVNLSGTDLREAKMDGDTNLTKAILSTATRLGDIRWNGVPLTRVDWSPVRHLGDESLLSDKVKVGDTARSKTRSERVAACQDIARAYRGLANALRAQSMNPQASGYRLLTQRWERRTLRAQRKVLPWLGSGLLDLIAGYGERPGRIFISYLVVVLSFAAAYFGVTHLVETGLAHLSWDESLVLSLTSFHGRGFFPGFLSLGDWVSRIAALEAVIGLFIELVLIATFSRRFLGD